MLLFTRSGAGAGCDPRIAPDRRPVVAAADRGVFRHVERSARCVLAGRPLRRLRLDPPRGPHQEGVRASVPRRSHGERLVGAGAVARRREHRAGDLQTERRCGREHLLLEHRHPATSCGCIARRDETERISRRGAYRFSVEANADVDPEIAPDQSFLVLASSGRSSKDDAKEHLFIVFNRGGSWGAVQRIRYVGDDANDSSNDNEPDLGPDGRTLYFSSDRSPALHFPRSRGASAGGRSAHRSVGQRQHERLDARHRRAPKEQPACELTFSVIRANVRAR